MRYLGGKHRLSPYIVEILKTHRKPNQLYLEPFVGSASVFEKMDNPRIGADIHFDVISLLVAVRDGWNPPLTIPENIYKLAAKHKEKLSPQLRAFISIGCSFGGKEWAGYARAGTRDITNESSRNLLQQKEKLVGASFVCVDYRQWKVAGALIYCDPPYANTEKYKTGEFNSEQFWETMSEWAKQNTVLVSEYACPLKKYEIVGEWKHYTSLSETNTFSTSEKLFLIL